MLSADEVPPGGEVALTVVTRPRTAEQKNEFPVYITSNDPVSPEATLIARAITTAPVPVQAEPSSLAFGDVAVRTAPTREIRVLIRENSLSQEFAHCLVTSTTGMVSAELKPSGSPGGLLTIEVCPRSDLPLGSFADTVVLHVGTAINLEIPVQGRVVPAVVVSPDCVYFGDVSGDPTAVASRDVVLRRADGKGLDRVAKVEAPPGLVVKDVSDAEAVAVTRRLKLTLDKRLVGQDLRDCQVRVWLGSESSAFEIKVVIASALRAR
jgi:hypothetical protein